MKRTALFCAVILCITAAMAFADQETEKAAIRKAVEDYYFMGQRHNDRELLGRIFHESARLHAVLSDGSSWTMSAPEWIQRKDPGKAASNDEYYIDEIRITGAAASVTARTIAEEWIIIDYLNMLKIDGQWKIVNKIFYSIKR